MKIALVLGTAREGRESEKVAKVVHDVLKEQDDVHATFVDVRDHLETFATTRFGMEDEKEHAWKNIACDSDGFIFVLPEYNHGYPGEWKLLMDSLYKKEYIHKAAGLVGVSSGMFGGVRCLELATLTLATRGMYVMKDTLNFMHVKEQFDDTGALVEEAQKERVSEFVVTMVEHTRKHTI